MTKSSYDIGLADKVEFTYTYDAKKRVISKLRSEGGYKRYSTYVYTETEIIEKVESFIKDKPSDVYTYVYRIGYEGRIDFMKYKSDNAEGLFIYTYDKEGYLIKIVSSNSKDASKHQVNFTYTDNTMIEQSDDTGTYITTFSKTKAPNNYLFTEYPDYPQFSILHKYFGKRNNYLISAFGRLSSQNDLIYTYKYDNKSNIISSTAKSSESTIVRNTSYSCN